jgi:hypothetical protein
MEQTVKQPSGTRRIHWLHVSTVISAAILISAEVFGATFAGAWAVALLFGLGDYPHYILQAIFFVIGMFVMASFIRSALKVEPFVTYE